MKTREKIKSTAIEMFNGKGASNVSTVILSEKMDISPGNLYYYFENKEHIIRCIWEEDMLPENSKIFSSGPSAESAEGISEFLIGISHYFIRYRFFYLELFTVLKNDPIMCKNYMKHIKKIRSQLLKIFESWEARGIMDEIPETQKHYLADDLLYAGFSSVKMSSVINEKTDPKVLVRNSVMHMYFVLTGFLTEPSKQKLNTLLEEKGFNFSGSGF